MCVLISACAGQAGIFGRFLQEQKGWQMPFPSPVPQSGYMDTYGNKHIMPTLNRWLKACPTPHSSVDLTLPTISKDSHLQMTGLKTNVAQPNSRVHATHIADIPEVPGPGKQGHYTTGHHKTSSS